MMTMCLAEGYGPDLWFGGIGGGVLNMDTSDGLQKIGG